MTAPLAVKPPKARPRTTAEIAIDVERQAKVCRACGVMKPFAERLVAAAQYLLAARREAEHAN